MKKYVTPVLTSVELRVEETIATQLCTLVGSCLDDEGNLIYNGSSGS